MGQVAGIMHGSRELTGDLDLLWDGDLGQAPALAAAFAAAGASLADDEGRLVPCEPAAFSLGSRMNRSHLKHSTASTMRASTSRIASSYPGRYFRGLVGSFLVTPMSLSDSRYTTGHHHRCKRAEGWQLAQPEPGILVWRVPAGRTYTTTPTRYPG